MKVRVANMGEMGSEFVPEGIKRQGNYVIVSLKSKPSDEISAWTSGPGPSATFSMAVAADYSDMIKIIKLALKLSVISFLLFGIKSRKKPRPLEEF